jgi:hypothetical protein
MPGDQRIGANNQESLIPRGWQRADALAVFLGPKEGLPVTVLNPIA